MGISERFFRACEYFKLVDEKPSTPIGVQTKCAIYRFDYDSTVDYRSRDRKEDA